jgi:hypothetical protein
VERTAASARRTRSVDLLLMRAAHVSRSSMTGARPDNVEIRSTAIISDAFATGENGLPFADDPNSLPFAIGEGKGWGGGRRAQMSLGCKSNPLPTSPCAARKGRSRSSTEQNSLPFAIGEGKGWGGVRRAPMSLGCRSNPLPTSPCAARKGRSRSSPERELPPLRCAQEGGAVRRPVCSTPGWRSSEGTTDKHGRKAR